jgi:hypothetical protein
MEKIKEEGENWEDKMKEGEEVLGKKEKLEVLGRSNRLLSCDMTRNA